jgi:hypothetical protein
MASPEVIARDDSKDVETRRVANTVNDAVDHHPNVQQAEDDQGEAYPVEDSPNLIRDFRRRGALPQSRELQHLWTELCRF